MDGFSHMHVESASMNNEIPESILRQSNEISNVSSACHYRSRTTDKTHTTRDMSSCDELLSSSDLISLIVRGRSGGMALYSSLLVAFVMVIDSLISVVQYTQQYKIKVSSTEGVLSSMDQYSMPLYPTDLEETDGICSSSIHHRHYHSESGSMMTQMEERKHPIWEEIIDFQIGLIQCLMHASLLGAAVWLVYLRGDVIWLFFVRNFFFFTFIMSLIMLTADVFKLILMTDLNKTNSSIQQLIRLVLIGSFTGTTAIAYIMHEQTCWMVRSAVLKDYTTESSVILSLDSPKTVVRNEEIPDKEGASRCPVSSFVNDKIVPRKSSCKVTLSSDEKKKSNLIQLGALLSQVAVLAFLLTTTTHWIKLQLECRDYMEMFNEFTETSSDHTITSMNDTEIYTPQNRAVRLLVNGVQNFASSMSIDQSLASNGDVIGSGDLSSYRMSYTMFGHYAFLLAMIQLSTVYPNDQTCLLVTLLCVLWRILVAASNLAYLGNHFSSNTMITTRHSWSLLYTCLEFVTMLPILYAAGSLFVPKVFGGRRKNDEFSTTRFHRIFRRKIKYGCIVDAPVSARTDSATVFNECTVVNHSSTFSSSIQCSLTNGHNTFDERHLEEGVNMVDDQNKDGLVIMSTVVCPSCTMQCDCKEHVTESTIVRYSCTTLQSIADPTSNYSITQRAGASYLLYGSMLLFAIMQIEAMILLRQSFIGTHSAFDIYKWGLHLTSIYLFTSHMCTSCGQDTYRMARLLLLFTCPVGSILAAWQLSVLVRNAYSQSIADNAVDVWTIFVCFLFGFRCLSGLIQIVGLMLLQHINPASTILAFDDSSPSNNLTDQQASNPKVSVDAREQFKNVEDTLFLDAALKRVTIALYGIYMPSFVLFVLFTSLVGNCSDPMISTMLPPLEIFESTADIEEKRNAVCMIANMDLMLAQNWPGMELFFHFGIVVILFASIGLSRSLPAFKSSTIVSIYFSGSLTCLIATHIFIWDVFQTNGWKHLSRADVARRVLLCIWMMASCYLTLSLHRFWKLRQLPVHGRRTPIITDES